MILIYEAGYSLIDSWGCDPDIGIRLPNMLVQAGFKDLDVIPDSKRAKPAPLCKWIETTNKNHTNLVQQNLISADEMNAYYELIHACNNNKQAVFTATAVHQIIAYK